MFSFYGGFSAGNQCYLFIDPGTCSQGQDQGTVTTNSGFPPGAGYIVGNGNCGKFTSSTSDG